MTRRSLFSLLLAIVPVSMMPRCGRRPGRRAEHTVQFNGPGTFGGTDKVYFAPEEIRAEFFAEP